MKKTEESNIEQWRSAMFAQPLDRLHALADNYIGQGGNSSSKSGIVEKLAVILAREATQEAALAMLDDQDSLIMGCIAATRGITRTALRELVDSALNYFDLEYKLANLLERLLVYERPNGQLAIVPFFEEPVRQRFANAEFLFGAGMKKGAGKRSGGAASQDLAMGQSAAPSGELSLLDLSLLLYSFLRYEKKPLLKNGLLSVHSKARLQKIAAADEETRGILEAIVSTLGKAGIWREGEQGFAFDAPAFRRFVTDYAAIYPFALAGILADGFPPANAEMLAHRMRTYFESGFVFSATGLARCSRLLLTGSENGAAWPDYLPAMKQLGLIRKEGGNWVCQSDRAFTPRPISTLQGKPNTGIVIEGTGTVHVLPSASIGDILSILDIGFISSISDAWDVEITKETAKKAFAEGQTAQSLLANLGRLCSADVPQTLKYTMTTWEEEYNALVLYRGSVLAVNENTARIIEQSGALAGLSYRKIREGVYYFGSIPHAIIVQVLERLGLPAPSLILSAKGGKKKESIGVSPSPRQIEALDSAQPYAVGRDDGSALDIGIPLSAPEPSGCTVDKARELPEIRLLAAARAMQLPEPVEKLIGERINRKLVYSEEQLVALSRILLEKMGARTPASPKRSTRGLIPGPVSAGGLDFQGKLHIIQSALKSRFSKLEIRWTSGGKTKSSILRPVSLTRTADDYLLTGEETTTGQALSIRVGSISQIRQEKGFLLGDE
ncbi:MAG: hypothetical protein LLF89_00975 [Spirochaetaceae bacterium]|nr:hypothetical protein [Spirochaetaceae bacterium]